ncbi:pyruvate kinase [Nitrosomonas sp.]|uniref:pyruvate kinase n=1 Tax=Nitrosomonas sp. TaxID=42353 RepID=UPI002731AFEC|nr:pyruvate kinase [Nitrosomonas sp.]MDP1786418.1 pyruvate kinase [Nitrosomonas sp.]MDP2224715.1 pyruvate kinase [Nitrosomonas sp.]
MIKQKPGSRKSEELHPYASLLNELEGLRSELLALECSSSTTLQHVHPCHLFSAVNLIHYLGLRRRDIRSLQERLAAVGLSSLGRMESHVFANLNAIIDLLSCALGKNSADKISPLLEAAGAAQLGSNTNQLFGKPPAHRRVRIMVTMPGEVADDYSLIKNMLIHGMDCARINCAHDTPEIWNRMIAHINLARRETGRPCRILMDLGGPKLRTGEIAAGQAVLKWKPQRDLYGNVIAPARIWLHPENDTSPSPAPADACLPVQGDWLAKASSRDIMEFTDARGSSRVVQLVDQIGAGFWGESSQTTYITPGIELNRLRVPMSGHPRRAGCAGIVGALSPLPELIRLHIGDSLNITSEPLPGKPAQFDARGRLLHAASIACSLPEVFLNVQPGERILIDDGRIGGVIRSVCRNRLVVEITQAREGGEKLLANKGINLPDSRLELNGLTAQDIEHLGFVVKHADMVGLSFARRPADILLLQKHLKRLKAEKLGIVLKIETRAAFENLPELLLTLLRSSNVGVMIARGDLAVECGYERLAELQEEILWLAEAARLPVIWATQVLEGLSKSGKPSRAEITDAAMGVRAECVMLNKGSHIIEAIQSLDDILHRMQSHQNKKISLLRRLHW